MVRRRKRNQAAEFSWKKTTNVFFPPFLRNHSSFYGAHWSRETRIVRISFSTWIWWMERGKQRNEFISGRRKPNENGNGERHQNRVQWMSPFPMESHRKYCDTYFTATRSDRKLKKNFKKPTVFRAVVESHAMPKQLKDATADDKHRRRLGNQRRRVRRSVKPKRWSAVLNEHSELDFGGRQKLGGTFFFSSETCSTSPIPWQPISFLSRQSSIHVHPTMNPRRKKFNNDASAREFIGDITSWKFPIKLFLPFSHIWKKPRPLSSSMNWIEFRARPSPGEKRLWTSKLWKIPKCNN